MALAVRLTFVTSDPELRVRTAVAFFAVDERKVTLTVAAEPLISAAGTDVRESEKSEELTVRLTADVRFMPSILTGTCRG